MGGVVWGSAQKAEKAQRHRDPEGHQRTTVERPPNKEGLCQTGNYLTSQTHSGIILPHPCKKKKKKIKRFSPPLAAWTETRCPSRPTSYDPRQLTARHSRILFLPGQVQGTGVIHDELTH